MSEISFDPKLEGVASGALRRAAASCLFIAASLAFAISISLSFVIAYGGAEPCSPHEFISSFMDASARPRKREIKPKERHFLPLPAFRRWMEGAPLQTRRAFRCRVEQAGAVHTDREPDPLSDSTRFSRLRPHREGGIR
jgi:hypothetical protein